MNSFKYTSTYYPAWFIRYVQVILYVSMLYTVFNLISISQKYACVFFLIHAFLKCRQYYISFNELETESLIAQVTELSKVDI